MPTLSISHSWSPVVIFINRPQYKKTCMFGYSGAPRWPIQKSDRVHLASQLSSHLYRSTYNIWKQSVQDVSSYRVHKDMSADAT